MHYNTIITDPLDYIGKAPFFENDWFNVISLSEKKPSESFPLKIKPWKIAPHKNCPLENNSAEKCSKENCPPEKYLRKIFS